MMSKRKIALNPGTTAKKPKPRGKPFTGRDDPRTNLKGAPKRGMSWKEIIKTVGDLTPKEASDYCYAVASKIGSIGNEVTLKEAVILRVYAALLFEPEARLLNVIIDRDEGKVTQPVTEIPWREYVRQLGYDPDTLMREAERIVNERFTAMGDTASDRGGNPISAKRADSDLLAAGADE